MENNITLVSCNPPIHIFLKPTVGEHCVCGETSYENLFEGHKFGPQFAEVI